MKRFLSILLLSIYAAFAVGLVVNTHYCGNSLASISIFSTAQCACEETNTKDKKDDCCKNEFKTLKIVDDQQRSEVNTISKIVVQHNSPSCFILFAKFNKHLAPLKIIALAKSPHAHVGLPIYKRIHSYLFYS